MGCTDVNGGPDTNGDAGCEKLPYFCDAAVGNLCQPESCGSASGTHRTEARAFCAAPLATLCQPEPCGSASGTPSISSHSCSPAAPFRVGSRWSSSTPRAHARRYSGSIGYEALRSELCREEGGDPGDGLLHDLGAGLGEGEPEGVLARAVVVELGSGHEGHVVGEGLAR